MYCQVEIRALTGSMKLIVRNRYRAFGRQGLALPDACCANLD
jgi:hypothetical protein